MSSLIPPSVPARTALVGLLALAACTAPAPAPLVPHDLTRSVRARSGDAEALEAGLELAGLAPLSIAVPPRDALADPHTDAYWHAWAWVSSPAMRAARRRVAATRASARSAGQPGPIQARAEIQDLDEPQAGSRLFGTFDLIGLMGLGPAGTARALADAETLAALGALEQVLWETRCDVDRQRVRVATLRGARQQLQQLDLDLETDRRRIRILERHGRLAAGAHAAAQAVQARLRARIAHFALEESRAVEALAVLVGLGPDTPALAALDGAVIGAVLARPRQSAPSAEALLTALPVLRTTLLDYAVAEARLRHVAMQRWPGLQIGPHLLWRQPDVLLGAMIASQLPWPGSLDGRIEAASVAREAARERVEDALLEARWRLRGAREQLDEARTRLEQGAEPALDGSARLWTAARAAFSVDPSWLDRWTDALSARMAALEAHALARGAQAQAVLDLERARGPGPDAAHRADPWEERS